MVALLAERAAQVFGPAAAPEPKAQELAAIAVGLRFIDESMDVMAPPGTAIVATGIESSALSAERCTSEIACAILRLVGLAASSSP